MNDVCWRLAAVLLTIGFCTSSCRSTKQVAHPITKAGSVDASLDMSKGIVFSLPRTVVSVTVPIEKTVTGHGTIWVELIRAMNADAIKSVVKPANLKQLNAMNAVVNKSLLAALDTELADAAKTAAKSKRKEWTTWGYWVACRAAAQLSGRSSARRSLG